MDHHGATDVGNVADFLLDATRLQLGRCPQRTTGPCHIPRWPHNLVVLVQGDEVLPLVDRLSADLQQAFDSAVACAQVSCKVCPEVMY